MKGKDLLVKCGFLVALRINAVLEEMVVLIMTVVENHECTSYVKSERACVFLELRVQISTQSPGLLLLAAHPDNVNDHYAKLQTGKKCPLDNFALLLPDNDIRVTLVAEPDAGCVSIWQVLLSR